LAIKMLTNVSVAGVYHEATFRSEMSTQSCLAENLVVLEEQGDWIRVRLEDDYEGWVCRFFVVEKPEAWDTHNFVYNSDQISLIYQNPDLYSATLRDMTMLSGLPCLQRKEGWAQILLPDGNKGWIEDHPRQLIKTMDVEKLVQTAFDFMGIQYLWGGRSPKGFDCSGFVQTVFKLNGRQLLRDAYQQAEIGLAVNDDFTTWQVGDLIFFSEHTEKITHVAISLGNGDFIHSSGYVRLNSLNPDHADLYLEKYSKNFTRTKRII